MNKGIFILVGLVILNLFMDISLSYSKTQLFLNITDILWL